MNEQLVLDIEGADSIILESRAEQSRAEQRSAPLSDKVAESIKALKLAAEMSKTYYHEPLIITYSGGKDSDVLLHLAECCLGADEFEVLNSHTSVDAPETVYHIREVFKRLQAKGIKATVHQPRDKEGNPITMWNLIPQRQIPPTRTKRYCCSVLKETSTPNRLCAVGVREAESQIRKGRDIFCTRGKRRIDALYFSLDHTEEVHKESQEIQDDNWDCTLIKTMKQNEDTIVNPIYYWSDEDIWQYIKLEGIKTNPLYEKGYLRVGCIGCPLANYGQVMKMFKDFPKYKMAYLKAFQRMLKVRADAGKNDFRDGYHNWKTPEDVFEWWIETYKRQVKGQIGLFDEAIHQDD